MRSEIFVKLCVGRLGRVGNFGYSIVGRNPGF